MVRFILNNRLVCPEELSAFSYEGFEYAPLLGDSNNPHFIREFIKQKYYETKQNTSCSRDLL